MEQQELMFIFYSCGKIKRKMKNRYFIIVLVILLPFAASAQYGETIRTARPGQAIGGYTLGSKVFQVQSGISYNEFEDESNNQTTWLNNNVFRLGIWEKFEISAVVNYRWDDTETATGNRLSQGISNTQIGARYNILEASGAIPAIGIQGRVLLKAQSEVYRREKIGTRFILAAGNRITDWMSYTTNFGLIWRGDGQGPDGTYVLNLAFGLTDKIGTFVEVYGITNDPFTTNFDTGFSYLVNKDFQLDISAGWQGNENIDDWFVDAGVSFRFDWRGE